MHSVCSSSQLLVSVLLLLQSFLMGKIVFSHISLALFQYFSLLESLLIMKTVIISIYLYMLQ